MRSHADILQASILAAVAASLVHCSEAATQDGAREPMLRQPSISGDGRQIAFVQGGDIYLVSSDGGAAERVVSHDATESSPRLSPKGDALAYTSTRSGGCDVYVLDLETREERRLTYHGACDVSESWSPDGSIVYFSSSRSDISGYDDVFAVPAAGGTPVPVSRSRYEGEYNVAPSPDGSSIAFNANDRVRQWWRMGPRTDDSTDIWIKSADPDELKARRVTTYPGKDSWPMWSPGGDGLYFVSNEGAANGAENIFYQSLLGEERRQVTTFDEGRVLWPTSSADGTIVFERKFKLWRIDDPDSAPRLIDVSLPARPTPAPEPETLDSISEFAVSGDQRFAAIVINGDVFVYDLQEDDLERVTNTPEVEIAVAISPDGDEVSYSALRDDFFDVYSFDRSSGVERRVTRNEAREHQLQYSPDGDWLAYAVGTDGLMATARSGETKSIALQFMINPMFTWSPDGRAIAYMATDENYFSNLHVVALSSDHDAVRITNFPNISDSGLTWTRDAGSLFLRTAMHRDLEQAVRISLTEGFVSAVESGEPISDDDATVEWLLSRNSVFELRGVSPSGDAAVFFGSVLGQQGLWLSAITDRGITDPRFVVTGREFATDIRDGGELYFLSNGKLHHLAVDASEPTTIDIAAAFEIDESVHRAMRLRHAWLLYRELFADETFNGKGWSELYEKYRPYIAGAANDDDLMVAARMMLGELNASHINIWGDSNWPSDSVGELGVDFRPRELREGRFVVQHSVMGASRTPIGAEDEILELDGNELDASTNINAILAGIEEDAVSARVRARDGDERDVELSLFDNRAVSNQRYENWVRSNEQIVDRLSAGRFAYIHLQNIGGGATENMRVELGADALRKDGLVLDIRNNGGGVESTVLLDFLQRQPGYAAHHQNKYTGPFPLIVGTPLLDLPVVLVQNEQVLSAAESFSHLFRAAEIGPIVGTRTAGWVKGSTSRTLFDGTRMSVGAYDATAIDGGATFDSSGQPPDVFVERDLQESLIGRDSQLEAAVAALAERLED